MSRSVWKGPFVDAYVLKKAEATAESGRHEVIKTVSYTPLTPTTNYSL